MFASFVGECIYKKDSARQISSHSLKATSLSMAAKRGLRHEDRLAMGHHIHPFRMADGYAREAQARCIRLVDRLPVEIKSGYFNPDASRAGRFHKEFFPDGQRTLVLNTFQMMPLRDMTSQLKSLKRWTRLKRGCSRQVSRWMKGTSPAHHQRVSQRVWNLTHTSKCFILQKHRSDLGLFKTNAPRRCTWLTIGTLVERAVAGSWIQITRRRPNYDMIPQHVMCAKGTGCDWLQGDLNQQPGSWVEKS